MNQHEGYHLDTTSHPETRVVLLGAGTPNADPERAGSAIAVVVGETAYLVDFGPGVVCRAAAACERGIAALAVSNLRLAFLTHLHADHTLGFADLILTPWILGREEPLVVYGLPGSGYFLSGDDFAIVVGIPLTCMKGALLCQLSILPTRYSVTRTMPGC
jgi:ribonuclease BN (tRNA processing enzyme)